ncbi:TPA: glycosyltransferase family 1 protein [bacterium]|nr:glycosyltransferase family 1 protein [bacterium]
MRILIVAPTPFFSDRGCHIRIYENTKILQGFGYDVLICTYHHGRDISGVRIKRIPYLTWYRKVEVGASWHKVYLDLILLVKTVWESIRFKPEIIYAYLIEGALIGYIASRLLRIPVIYDIQGIAAVELLEQGFIKSIALSNILKRFEMKLLGLADAVICNTFALAEKLKNKTNKEKVYLVRDMINSNNYAKARENRNERRERLGIRSETVVIYTGYFSKLHGIDMLLDAASLVVKKKIDNIRFVLIGYPEVQYRKMVTELGLEEKFIFIGRVSYEELPDYLSIGDVAISLKISATEGHGKLYHYLAAGLPTILYDTPVNHEIMGEAGLFVKTSSAEEVANAIILLLSDEKLRERLKNETIMRANLIKNCYYEDSCQMDHAIKSVLRER